AGFHAERPDEVVAARGRLQIFLLGVHLFDVRRGVLDQAVDVVSTAFVTELEWAADTERAFGALERTDDALREPLHALQVSAHFCAAGFRRDVGVATDLAHAINRRGRSFHDFDGVHSGEYGARMALHVHALHAAVVGVRLHRAHVDTALKAVTCRRVDT